MAADTMITKKNGTFTVSFQLEVYQMKAENLNLSICERLKNIKS